MKLKVDHFKQQVESFEKTFLIMEIQKGEGGGDLKEFFRHESSSWSSALSSEDCSILVSIQIS